MAIVFGLILYSNWKTKTLSEIALLEEDIRYYNSVGLGEQGYIATTILPNGAIAYGQIIEGENPVIPYFSDSAAMGLLSDFGHDYTPLVKDYINWRFSAQEEAGEDKGIIYDYTVVLDEELNFVEETTDYKYDSIDSYAATFLILLEEYTKTTGDYNIIKDNKQKVEDVLNIMLSQLEENGLTRVSNENRIQYTFDNGEVSKALKSAMFIYTDVIPNEQRVMELTNILDEHTNAFDSLLYKDEMYVVGLHEDGEIAIFGENLEEFYPTAVAQLAPTLFGVVSPDDEKGLKAYQAFSMEHNWQSFEHVESTSSYWALTSTTAAIIGDEEKVLEYLENYRSEVAVNHEYPVYSGEAGWISLTCDTMIEKKEAEIKELDPLNLLTLD